MGCGCKKKSKCCNQCDSYATSCVDTCVQKSRCERICTALVADNSWNVPACGAEAVISFPGLTTVLIGSYLYNPAYGYFEIVGFNSINGEVTVSNPCFPQNAVAGTLVAALSEFVYSGGPQLTEYASWVPVVETQAGSTMAVDNLSILVADSFVIGTTRWFELSITFDLTGVADNTILISLPDTAVYKNLRNIANVRGPGSVDIQGSWQPYMSDPSNLWLRRTASANWTIGTGYAVGISGFYEIDV